jgi:hypothetical protein
MNSYILVIGVASLIIGLTSFSLSIYIFIFFKKLSKGVGKSDLIKVLLKLSEIEKNNSEDIKKINHTIEEIKKDAENHLQRVSFLRYNPFSEVGGDHSFSLAILDANLTGFIVTGLHTRERTRVYVKKVEKGKCKQELSKEEQEVLNKIV